MLKVLILFFGILGATTASFAGSSNATLEDRKFYLKAIADRGSFLSSKLPRTGATIKYKNNSPVNSMDLGAGYYFNNEFRGEILFHQEFDNKFEAHLQNAYRKGSKSTKNELSAVMLGFNMNIVDFDYGNIFLNCGLGVANVKEKISYHTTFTNRLIRANDESLSGKSKNNIAYGLGVGADFKLSERLHAEVAYRFNDYGETGSIKTLQGTEVGHNKLRSHNALIGLRVDM